MKIIKYGKVPPPIVFQGTCPFCETSIECTGDEVTYIENTSHPKRYEVKCPLENCPRNIEVTRKEYSLHS